MEYYVVQNKRYGLTKGEAVKELIEQVNEYLGKGYEPIGGILIMPDGKYFMAYQAVIKR